MEVGNDKIVESLSIQPRLSYETVAANIVKLVANRGLKPGDKLPTEQEMTEMFGVSRTVVREAIKALASNGLVRSRQGSGLYVADETQSANILPFVFTATIKPETVAQLFEFRCFMEKEIVRQAVHKITVKELRSLEKALKIHRQGAETHNREIFHQGDSMFHRVLAESTHNIFFIQSHNNLWHLLQIILEIAVGETIGSFQLAVDQHQKLYDCIREGDEEGAVSTIEEHITSSSNPYLQAITNVMINKSYSTKPQTSKDEELKS